MVGFVDDDEIEAAAGDVRSMIAAARERERGDQRNVTRLFAYGQTEQRGAAALLAKARSMRGYTRKRARIGVSSALWADVAIPMTMPRPRAL